MNSFQILDKQGNPIAINILDKEAAEFWDVTMDDSYYASPGNNSNRINWFDCIGWNIAMQTNCFKKDTWQNVINTLFNTLIDGEFVLKAAGDIFIGVQICSNIIAQKAAYLEPYINLVNHWNSKGYTPKQII